MDARTNKIVMKQIVVNLLRATSENGNAYYGGEVLLDGELIKFVPLSELKKENMEAYLNLLRNRLSYVKRGNYEFVIRMDSMGNYLSTYWSSVPGEQFYALHVKK